MTKSEIRRKSEIRMTNSGRDEYGRIRDHGILQSLLVRPIGDLFEIIEGCHRFTARPHAEPRARRALRTHYEHMLQAIASHEIANRPNRLEPRQRKRRPKPYALMTKPRPQARKQEAKIR